MAKGNDNDDELKQVPPKKEEDRGDRGRLPRQRHTHSDINNIISEFNLARGSGNTQEERINDELSNIRVTAQVLLSRVSNMTMQEAQNTLDWVVRQISTLRSIQASGSKYDAGLFNDASRALGDLMSAVLTLAADKGWSLKLDPDDLKVISEDDFISPFIPWDLIEKHF